MSKLNWRKAGPCRVGSGVTEIAKAICCQLNNGVFRLGNWRGNATGN